MRVAGGRGWVVRCKLYFEILVDQGDPPKIRAPSTIPTIYVAPELRKSLFEKFSVKIPKSRYILHLKCHNLSKLEAQHIINL